MVLVFYVVYLLLDLLFGTSISATFTLHISGDPAASVILPVGV